MEVYFDIKFKIDHIILKSYWAVVNQIYYFPDLRLSGMKYPSSVFAKDIAYYLIVYFDLLKVFEM